MTNGDIVKIAALAAVSAVLLGSAIGIQEALAQTAQTCAQATADVTIDDAKVVPRDAKQSNPKDVRLGDVIAVTITNLDKLYNQACKDKTLVLFLNGHPIKSLTPYPPNDPNKDGVLQFTLRTETSRLSWTPILGRPGLDPREMKVSVGFQDGFPLKGTNGKPLPVLELDIINNGWFVMWILFFLIMVVVFLYCAWRTNIIRNGDPTEGSAQALGTYSLSKTQGAWWFFVIVASYLLIGIVAGDFSSSINNTALILLGIGAGTVPGSAAIDASKDTPEIRAKERDEAATMHDRLDAIDKRLEEIDWNLADPAKSNQHPALLKERAELSAEKAQDASLYRKLTRQSEHFITDILSDANGVNFHRFQIAVWTLVLSIVFIKEVYENLAMPVFDTTLMGLLGLSAGTYLGLKIPEPTSPK